jgi:predicted component of type VI protein secretion system
LRATGIDIRDLGIGTTMEGLHSRTPVELQTLLEAERSGAPFLVLRRGGVQVIHVLPPEGRVTLGREVACDLAFVDDHEVSRLHAELERVGGHWVLADHGLSRNGTFLNGERLQGERALHDGDTVRIGASQFVYRAPDESPARPTEPAAGAAAAESLTPTQRAVLAALCRPYKDASPFATPASNQAIAEEVGLSVPRVKAHLTDLYERLGVGDLPHNAKRAKLVETAFQRGALSVRDL